MKLRSDSPFASFDQETRESLLLLSEKVSDVELHKYMGSLPNNGGVPPSLAAIRRFLKRMREDRAVRELEESKDAVSALTAAADPATIRVATLAAARQRMFDLSLESKDPDCLMKAIKLLNDEQVQEQRVEMEKRRLQLEADAGQLAWRKLEYEKAMSALKLLPRLWQILNQTENEPKDLLLQARRFMLKEGGNYFLHSGPEESLEEKTQGKLADAAISNLSPQPAPDQACPPTDSTPAPECADPQSAADPNPEMALGSA